MSDSASITPEIRQLIHPSSGQIRLIQRWMYEWWGKPEGYSEEEVCCYVERGFQIKRLPQTYGLFLNHQLIGCYQFIYCDDELHPDIYPWLANVYLDPVFRGKGLGRFMLQSVKENALNNTSFDELYLYTYHVGLYEKHGWKYISDIDMINKTPRIQRLYRLDLNAHYFP